MGASRVGPSKVRKLHQTARGGVGAEQAAQNARAFVACNPDPAVNLSPDGTILDANLAAGTVAGLPHEDLIGTQFSRYFSNPAEAQKGFLVALRRGGVTDLPLQVRRPDGTFVELAWSAIPYKNLDGQTLGVVATAHDVTAAGRLVRELEDTRQFLNNILQSSIKYSIVGMDLDQKILSWNEGAVRNYGYPATEVIGRHSSFLHRPEDLASGAVEALFRAALERGLAEAEFDRVRKDGSTFTASVVVSRRSDASGNPIGYLLMSSDVSEKRHAERRLLDASEYVRSLIEASLDPLVAISPDGKITDVNEATVQVTGVHREDLIGTDFSAYFTEPERARAGYLEVLQNGLVTDYALTIRHKDGGLVDVLYNASVYKDPRGNVLGVFAAARDVTAQKQTYQYIRSLIEASLDPLVTISADGKITDVNEATIQVTGVPRDRLIGTDFSDYFTEPEKARAGYRTVFEEGLVTDYPLTIRSKEGRLTDVLYNASLYKDSRGTVLGVFAAARDVTARKRAEAELARERTRELERLAELERFQRLTVGRELKMIELKQEIEELKQFVDSQKLNRS